MRRWIANHKTDRGRSVGKDAVALLNSFPMGPASMDHLVSHIPASVYARMETGDAVSLLKVIWPSDEKPESVFEELPSTAWRKLGHQEFSSLLYQWQDNWRNAPFSAAAGVAFGRWIEARPSSAYGGMTAEEVMSFLEIAVRDGESRAEE